MLGKKAWSVSEINPPKKTHSELDLCSYVSSIHKSNRTNDDNDWFRSIRRPSYGQDTVAF